MKTSKLKPLIKTVLKEIYRRHGGYSSGTLEEFEIEFENLVIPGISTAEDLVYVNISVEYEASAGSPARGMFGPPEHSSPEEPADVSIIDHSVGSITVKPEQGQSKQMDITKLSPEQQQIVKKAVNDYVNGNEDTIVDKIMDKQGSYEPQERDYFEDR